MSDKPPVYYETEAKDITQQTRFYRQGDIMVNRQGVPYRLTPKGWVLLTEEEKKALGLS